MRAERRRTGTRFGVARLEFSNSVGVERMTSDPPNLITVPGGRIKEAEQAALDLVRAMGEGDIVEGLGKLEMLQVLDDMRCDWMEILQHGLPELTPRQAPVREPHLVTVKRAEN